MANLTNIRTVSVPSIGKLPLSENPGTFTPSGTSRKHKPGRLASDGGFTESEQPAKLDLSLNLVPGTDVDAIGSIKDEDVTVRMSDGTVYLMPQAYATEPVAIGDGEAKVTIMSNTSEKI
jgi:hypothetical protein